MPSESSKHDPQVIVAKIAGMLRDSEYNDISGDERGGRSTTAGPKKHQKESDMRLLANAQQQVHKLGKKGICATDERGYPTPGDQSPQEIMLDASEGFVPLWEYGSTLRWCFDDVSFSALEDSAGVRREVRRLMLEAALAWGDAAPVKFKEERESYDFRIVVHSRERCTPFGCTLASAFFPDSGRHNLEIYPTMFEQSDKEQVDTIVHEMGHIFGLRHFFADVRERQWPSVIFGTHRPFSIMNYGSQSELTDDDRNDLRRLYQAVWSGRLADINGTPIRLFRPYHAAGSLVTPRFFDGELVGKRDRVSS